MYSVDAGTYESDAEWREALAKAALSMGLIFDSCISFLNIIYGVDPTIQLLKASFKNGLPTLPPFHPY